MNWRPKGWINPCWIKGNPIYEGDFEKAKLFEDGADAMLVAIQNHRKSKETALLELLYLVVSKKKIPQSLVDILNG